MRQTHLYAAQTAARPLRTRRRLRPSLTRSHASLAQSHVANMGRMVEEMENQMRDALQTIYFGKTKTVVNGLYKAAGEAEEQKKRQLQMQLQAEMAK